MNKVMDKKVIRILIITFAILGIVTGGVCGNLVQAKELTTNENKLIVNDITNQNTIKGLSNKEYVDKITALNIQTLEKFNIASDLLTKFFNNPTSDVVPVFEAMVQLWVCNVELHKITPPPMFKEHYDVIYSAYESLNYGVELFRVGYCMNGNTDVYDYSFKRFAYGISRFNDATDALSQTEYMQELNKKN